MPSAPGKWRRRFSPASETRLEASKENLPVLGLRERLKTACSRSRRIVLQAPTGSGKSTQIPQMLLDDGIEKRLAAERFAAMFGGKTLIVAYNAQFDLCFLYYFLAQFGMADVLKGAQMLDALTVYKDRRPFPHKLCNAVDAYQLKTQNTHRAIDDARATLELLTAMEEEEQDLERYVNLFGYNPKFGAPRPAIHSVTYLPQGYNRTGKLYDEVPAFL